MELNSDIIVVENSPTEASPDWLINADQGRRLALPFATGVVAVEGAMQELEIAKDLSIGESLSEQLIPASAGYAALVESLNIGRSRKNVLAVADGETITSEFNAWFNEDKLAYVAAAQEADPEVRFTLVATPNVLVNAKDLMKAGKTFAQNQPAEIDVWEPLYSKYSAQQLSGTNPDNGHSVVFSLIPSATSPELIGTVNEQRAKLAKLQADNPNIKVPSPLEAIAYWQTLRAQGDPLTDYTTFERTFIRHFDLPEQLFDGLPESAVPRTNVRNGGKPFMRSSYADDAHMARIAVG
jgi:hypothetical protein